MNRYLLFTLFILSLFSCTKKYESLPHGYYTMEFHNFAWGEQHDGWMIDKDGNIMSFNLPEEWNYADSLGYISEEHLQENLARCTEKLGKTTKRRLYLNNKLIAAAAEGTLSERKNIGADMGATTYLCYQYDKEKNLYKRVVLDTEGDWSYYNQSQEAKEITRWMKQFGS